MTCFQLTLKSLIGQMLNGRSCKLHSSLFENHTVPLLAAFSSRDFYVVARDFFYEFYVHIRIPNQHPIATIILFHLETFWFLTSFRKFCASSYSSTWCNFRVRSSTASIANAAQFLLCSTFPMTLVLVSCLARRLDTVVALLLNILADSAWTIVPSVVLNSGSGSRVFGRASCPTVTNYSGRYFLIHAVFFLIHITYLDVTLSFMYHILTYCKEWAQWSFH